MPGGEVILQRILSSNEDGVDDIQQFMLRSSDQKILCEWLYKNRNGYFLEGDYD
jgi:hypothetical protein